jgi:peptidoglycan/xylan/chitin deacetylase (PgdA/CDA1 family)
MFYPVKTPWWLKLLYRRCTWQMPGKEKVLYLTFDDGPHPFATPFVLDELKKYNAKATFFCIGKNVFENRKIYERIITEGHQTGNHTHNHLDGWATKNETYLQDIAAASGQIRSSLFRPPYGRIKRAQIKLLQQYKIIMWTVLSGDFDKKLAREKCAANVTRNAESGAVVVFHDSEKAFENMRYALPVVLEYFTRKGYRFEALK